MEAVTSARSDADQAVEEREVARHPGESYQDIIARDRIKAPPILTTEHYRYLGNADISPERYISQEYADREMEHVWMRTWQWACRVEQIPEPGDYYIYNIGHVSLLVVRGEDMEIRAFYNFCMHRGTKLRTGEGMGHTAKFTCPFHGWTFGLTGSLDNIPCKWDFDHVDQDKSGLRTVRSAIWGGFVFINLDPTAPPLEDYLAPLPDHFREWDMGKRYMITHITKDLPCNWKAAAEAFMEQYHLRQTHPQLVNVIADTNTQYDVYGRHVSRFVAAMATPSPEVKEPLPPEAIVAGMIISDNTVQREQAEIKEGETARNVIADFLRKDLSDRYKQDFSAISDAELLDPIQYYVFPNLFVWPGVSIPIVYRFRPKGTDPENSVFELIYLKPYPSDGSEVPFPPEPTHLGENDSFTTLEQIDRNSAETFDQDTDNLRAQRDGEKFMTKGLTLSNYQEIRLRHLNQTLDLYMNTPLDQPVVL